MVILICGIANFHYLEIREITVADVLRFQGM